LRVSCQECALFCSLFGVPSLSQPFDYFELMVETLVYQLWRFLDYLLDCDLICAC